MSRHAPGSTLFPYTTLFRSRGRGFESPADHHAGLRWCRHPCETSTTAGAAGRDAHDNHHPDERQPNERMLFEPASRSEEHTSELQSHSDLVCRLLLENKKPR